MLPAFAANPDSRLNAPNCDATRSPRGLNCRSTTVVRPDTRSDVDPSDPSSRMRPSPSGIGNPGRQLTRRRSPSYTMPVGTAWLIGGPTGVGLATGGSVANTLQSPPSVV